MRRHSLRLTGLHDATPLIQQEPTFQPALTEFAVALAAWLLDYDTDSYYKISRAALDDQPAGHLHETGSSITSRCAPRYVSNTHPWYRTPHLSIAIDC